MSQSPDNNDEKCEQKIVTAHRGKDREAHAQQRSGDAGDSRSQTESDGVDRCRADSLQPRAVFVLCRGSNGSTRIRLLQEEIETRDSGNGEKKGREADV